jgi:hypothetical protein
VPQQRIQYVGDVRDDDHDDGDALSYRLIHS